MATVKEISVNVRRLIPMEKYANVTYESGITMSLEPTDDPAKVYQQALTFCKNNIAAEINRIEGNK